MVVKRAKKFTSIILRDLNSLCYVRAGSNVRYYLANFFFIYVLYCNSRDDNNSMGCLQLNRI